MFLNGLEQLLRRKLVITALLATLVFLGLYWWGVSAASGADLRGPGGHGQQYDPTRILTPADAALAAIITSGPMAATLISALMIIIGATMLPEEIDQGRMPFWLSLPQSRLRVYLMASLAPLALSYALATLLFAGIFVITRAYFPFVPREILSAPVSLLVWLAVIWSVVILLSLVVKKVAAMLIAFFLTAVSSLFGGFYEIMKMFPGEAPPALETITKVVMYVFPADRGYRGVLYGLIPRDAAITENLAFFGVTTAVPAIHLIYAAFFSLVLLGLGYWRFRGMDF